MKFYGCSRCKQGCYDKPGPTSVRTSIRARRRVTIRQVEMRHSRDLTLPNRLAIDGKTWFAPLQTNYQQPNASDIPIFKVLSQLTLTEGRKTNWAGSCAGK